METTSNHLESRVVKLETVIDLHKAELKELKNSSESLSKSLESIQHNLQQIKWAALGGVLGLFAQELGVLGILKSLLH